MWHRWQPYVSFLPSCFCFWQGPILEEVSALVQPWNEALEALQLDLHSLFFSLFLSHPIANLLIESVEYSKQETRRVVRRRRIKKRGCLPEFIHARRLLCCYVINITITTPFSSFKTPSHAMGHVLPSPGPGVCHLLDWLASAQLSPVAGYNSKETGLCFHLLSLLQGLASYVISSSSFLRLFYPLASSSFASSV